MAFKDEAKNERKRLYFNIICGVVFAASALIGALIVNNIYEITNRDGWIIGVTFLILYIVFCLFLIGVRIYNSWREKHFDDKKTKKDLKPPII